MLNTYKIAQNSITLIPSETANTFTATTTTTKPTDIEADAYVLAIWATIKKSVKSLHVNLYANSTPDVAVANAVYHVTFETTTRTIVIPLIDLLQGDSKNTYNNKATMLQTATAKFINTAFETVELRSEARAETEKSYKVIMQWAFDFLTAGREDAVKIHANDKDVDIISGMLLKLKCEKITTTGEKTIQSYIEFAFRQKIAGKDFFVNLYSMVKDSNNVKVTSVTPVTPATSAETVASIETVGATTKTAKTPKATKKVNGEKSVIIDTNTNTVIAEITKSSI